MYLKFTNKKSGDYGIWELDDKLENMVPLYYSCEPNYIFTEEDRDKLETSDDTEYCDVLTVAEYFLECI
jgi:hypothetical protein